MKDRAPSISRSPKGMIIEANEINKNNTPRAINRKSFARNKMENKINDVMLSKIQAGFHQLGRGIKFFKISTKIIEEIKPRIEEILKSRKNGDPLYAAKPARSNPGRAGKL